MTPISNWESVPEGTTVIEDTYNEIYVVFEKNNEKWLRQIGWRVGDKEVPETERPCDFEPNCQWDQPWFTVS